MALVPPTVETAGKRMQHLLAIAHLARLITRTCGQAEYINLYAGKIRRELAELDKLGGISNGPEHPSGENTV
jgi:predicted nucleic-acid-binding Zn-ribbon protein